MRITYVHQYFNTLSMSGGTRSYEIARRLVGMGHEVTMITSWRENDGRRGWFETCEAGVNVHWVPIAYSNHSGILTRLLAFIKFVFLSTRRASQLDTDVVFVTSTPLTVAVPGIIASKKHKVPLVFEVRDLWPDVPIAMGYLKNPIFRLLARWLEMLAYRSSQEVIALSPGMVSGVVRHNVIPAARVTEIPNSADLDFFLPNPERGLAFRRLLGIPEDKLLVVYTGTFGRVNRVDYLVNVAFALKQDDRFYFLTIGDGSEFEDVQALARERGIFDHNLRMLPRVPKSEMPDVLAAADIASSFVAPIEALEANSANKFFDGLSAGCCFVVNHGGWQAELLQTTGAGLQLSRDVNIAASQLQDLASQPETLRRAKLAARELAEQRFSRDVLAKRLEQVLLRAVRDYAIASR